MDSKTKFNRLIVCHSMGAGPDLPPACHSCIIRKVFVSPSFPFLVVSLLFLCLNADGLWSLSYGTTTVALQ